MLKSKTINPIKDEKSNGSEKLQNKKACQSDILTFTGTFIVIIVVGLIGHAFIGIAIVAVVPAVSVILRIIDVHIEHYVNTSHRLIRNGMQRDA